MGGYCARQRFFSSSFILRSYEMTPVKVVAEFSLYSSVQQAKSVSRARQHTVVLLLVVVAMARIGPMGMAGEQSFRGQSQSPDYVSKEKSADGNADLVTPELGSLLYYYKHSVICLIHGMCCM